MTDFAKPKPSDAPTRFNIALAAAGLVLLALTAYLNSFSVPFVFDDIPSIVENRSIRRLWPLSDVLFPDQAGGVTTSGRPLVNLSFALNYAVSAHGVWSYHALNVLIHACAGLCLFGVIRRTLGAAPLLERFGAAAAWLAFAAAAWWTLHPLQTESVTYVVQRAESLVSLFYLLVLYAFVRGLESPAPRGWFVLAVAACFAGMASKEVMVSAPVVVLLYDRAFWSGTFGEALRRRRTLYLGLAASWIALAWLVVGTGSRGGTAGFGTEISSWSYALTQCRAILVYVTVTLWPHPLVFDYGLATERDLIRVLPQALALVTALVGTGVALRRRSPWGFAGAMFFAVLAPSSSFVPIVTQTIAEHRMYLPLAVASAILVLGGFVLIGQRTVMLLGAAALALALLTVARNCDYRSEATIWADTAAKLPSNARAHNNLGQELFRAGKIDESIGCYQRALALQPKYPETLYNLGVALARLGRLAPAIERYEAAIRVQSHYPEAHNNLGNALVRVGRSAEAIQHYETALAQSPGFAEAINNLGNALLERGENAEATRRFEAALRLKPDYPEACYNLGNARAAEGKMAEALEQYRQALRLRPGYPEANVNAGNALLALDRPREALMHYEKATALDPQLADAHFNLGSALLQLERWREAIPPLETALRLKPDFAGVHRALGVALFKSGRPADAITHYEQHFRAEPRDAEARAELAQLKAEAGNVSPGK